MAKKALLDVLEQTIGKYVLNLDAESLNVAVWSGKIELNSLELNCDAVNAELCRQAAETPNLAIPFKVVSGRFDHFQVDVPWTQIMYRPVVLRANGLSIAVEPYNRAAVSDYLQSVHESETARSRHVEEQREASLVLADEYRKQANKLRDLASQDIEVSSTQSSSTFASRLVRRIIENLQIEIANVTVIVQSNGCSAGLTLDSLSLETTDEDGKPTFVDRTGVSAHDNSFLFKALRINGLGIYLDEKSNKMEHLYSIAEDSTKDFSVHSYVLAPLSFVAKLRQADSSRCVDYPKYVLASELTSLSFMLSKSQLEQARAIADQIRPSVGIANPLFPEYRPQKRVTRETALIWWKYAVRCIGRLNGRRSWVEFFRAFQLRKQYIPLYKRHAHAEGCAWMKTLTTWEVSQMRVIERDRTISVEGIMAWRNIADAQAKKEQEKHNANLTKAQSSIFASLFGSPDKKDKGSDEPPITLSLEELRALESFSVAPMSDSDLSMDSRLCDVKFVLGSCRICLSSYNDRPVTSLDIGAVSVSFDAKQDGSLALDLALSSLEVQDRVTPKTFFPTILKNQTVNDADSAFKLQFTKSSAGDQRLEVVLNTFETVASPTLLLELKQYATPPTHSPGATTAATTSPLLAQSMSGSVDLFYDATEGTERKLPLPVPSKETVSTFDDMSNALVDAWRVRTKSRAMWAVDLDIHAPIIVVPESCTDPRANVLVFDLGHLRLKYGNADDSSPKVEEWFRTNSLQRGGVDPILDYGSIQVRNLTFSLGKVNYWRRLVRKMEASCSSKDDAAVVEPISLSVSFGVESIVDVVPRICAIGVLPIVTLALSPTQLARILRVSNIWQKKLKDIFPENDDLEESADTTSKMQSSGQKEPVLSATTPQHSAEAKLISNVHPVLFARVQLQRLSIKVLDDGGNGIEGHLVSVTASTSKLSDGSSQSRLAMGWFWILDKCQNDFMRNQRLVVHSLLPLSTEEFAKDEKYDVMGALENVGVFLDSFVDSIDLAEITFMQSAAAAVLENMGAASLGPPISCSLPISSVLDARFTRLFIVWNPRAMRVISDMLSLFSRAVASTEGESDGVIISDIRQKRRLSIDSLRSKAESITVEPSALLIRANLDGLHISLNSARDDLPLFVGEMSSTQLCCVFGQDENCQVDLTVGELNVRTSTMGRTLPVYHTMLGLSSGKSQSLLFVRYCSGAKVLPFLTTKSVDLTNTEAFCEIELSPVRFVYVQSQVLALVEYATAGILGAVTAKAASSAVNAAADLATPSDSKKVFIVHAQGLELVLPQAAYKTTYVSAHLGSMQVEFAIMPDSSAEANFALHDVMMRDTLSEPLLQTEVQMSIHVTLPVYDVGTRDDQAMKVLVAFSAAHFLVTKKQYSQVLATLDENIGESDLCLREDVVRIDPVDATANEHPVVERLTHAGIEAVEQPRRLYLQVTLATLALSLFGTDQDDPIIQLSAIDAVIDFKSIFDGRKTMCQVSLRDMSCDDQRLIAMTRQYRSLVFQPTKSVDTEQSMGDLFFLAYEALEGESSSLELKIGSPVIVFIPDVINEVLEFLQTDRSPAPAEVSRPSNAMSYREYISVDADGTESGIETSFALEPEPSPVQSLEFSLHTSRCTVLFVDLGSDLLRQRGNRTLSMASTAEAIALSGAFEAKLSLETEKESNSLVSLDLQLHGNSIEAYTAFGHDLRNAIQILDPTQFSVYVDAKVVPRTSRKVNVSCAVISPVDITLSMRNIALLNAVLSSISEGVQTADTDLELTTKSLSRQEADRIEHLAMALESTCVEVTSHGQDTEILEEPSITKTNEIGIRSENSFKLTTSQVQLTFVNDLQGLDEALLRLTVRSAVANGRAELDFSRKDVPPFSAFDFNAHMSILADYFDASMNKWKVLLIDPWEVSSKCNRGASRRFQSQRPSTTIDVESLACHVSFSEQFLMSLASANRMWSVYSTASSSALESLGNVSNESKALKRSMAASAARTYISSLPYAVENHSGISLELVLNDSREERRTCDSGSLVYFMFDPPIGTGAGGRRLYGQDFEGKKAVSLWFGQHSLEIPHLDSQLGQPKQIYSLGTKVVMIDIVKEGKTTVVHVSSGINIHNHASVPFAISVLKEGVVHEVGICGGQTLHRNTGQSSPNPALAIRDGKVSKPSKWFGIPVDLVEEFRNDFAQRKDAMIAISFSPMIVCHHDGWKFSGGAKLRMNDNEFSGFRSSVVSKCFEIVCRPESKLSMNDSAPRDLFPFVLKAIVRMTLVNGTAPSIDLFIEPRAFIHNKMPISLTLKSPMPHVFGRSFTELLQDEGEIHLIEPNEYVEIFTPGPSAAVQIKCSDVPVGGTATDWIERGWVDLPLISDFRMQEPLREVFPFVRKPLESLPLGGARGVDFFIATGSSSMARLDAELDESSSRDVGSVELVAPPSVDEDWSSFFLMAHNFAVDHIGDILFEQLAPSSSNITTSATPQTSQVSPAIGAYATGNHRGRISLLPGSHIPIRLLHLSMEGDEGLRRSAPFIVEDISICDGGVDSTAVKWQDGSSSGFYAYRRLVSSYQSEVHIIPEFAVFNGSERYKVCVRPLVGPELLVNPGKLGAMRSLEGTSLMVTLEYADLGGRTRPIRVDTLGLRVALVVSSDGFAMGSVAVQTVVGARDSRLVLKLGCVKFGRTEGYGKESSSSQGLLRDDFLRFRIKWSELEMTLTEARPLTEKNRAIIESALDRIQKAATPTNAERSISEKMFSSAKSETWVEAREKYKLDRNDEESFRDVDAAVCTILFSRFTVDWQRVFKEDHQISTNGTLDSTERSQFAVVIHRVRIRDEAPNSPYPIVFDSTSQQAPFFNLCVRLKGEASSEFVAIDLLELNLAHDNGVSEKIYLNTNEDFVWKVLDLADRILVAAAEFAGVDIKLNWDDEHDGYVVAIQEKSSSYLDEDTKYEPPKSDTIYHIKKTYVSPFTCVVSFKRNPQSSRYKIQRGGKGAHLMNYFTRRLKFKIDKAELHFARYDMRDIKGPPDHIVDIISTVYMSRMKTKILTIVTASSFQDWKSLARRESGDDAYKEGDLLRATGNVAGSTANYLFKQAGVGLGSGVRNVASSLGDGIESATDAIGARSLGAGVNSVVSGVGEGVGHTISGVGSGTGKVFKSVGQGTGQVVGGLTGGILLVGKGIGKGITSGDGRAVANGLVQGGAAIGEGVGQGLESVVSGTADGVLSVGQGLFSGVRSIGKGIGGAITECCGCFSCCASKEEEQRTGVYSPLLPARSDAEV